MNKWRMNLFGLDVPVWGFKDTNYETFIIDTDDFNWIFINHTGGKFSSLVARKFINRQISFIYRCVVYGDISNLCYGSGNTADCYGVEYFWTNYNSFAHTNRWAGCYNDYIRNNDNAGKTNRYGKQDVNSGFV